MQSGWRNLGAYWAGVLLVLGAGAAILQWLGPPPPVHVAAVAPPKPTVQVAAAQPPRKPPMVTQARGIPPFQRPGRDTPGPIADPEPPLLAPGPDDGMLPQIAQDGSMPMQTYAAGFDYSDRRPRIGLIVAGIGLDQAASKTAIEDLPRAVTLAVSPYAVHLKPLLQAARFAEHEYVLSLPMEPQAFPLNDPGPRALMTSLPKAENLKRLDWLLSRVQGYVGVTAALGNGMNGERFAAVPEQMNPVLQQIARRGLLYVDARPGGRPLHYVWNRDVDLVVDRPTSAIEARLAELERIAHDKGSALGLVVAPRPVMVQRIRTWADTLQSRGYVLAPVSALVQPPLKRATKTETKP